MIMIGKNNPFNIRYSRMNNWKGQTGQTRGFCDFSDYRYSLRAAYILFFRTYKKRGLRTVAELINAYAPIEENKTDKYIKFICSRLGIFPFDIPASPSRFLWCVSRFEGNPLTLLQIDAAFEDMNLKDENL